MYPLNNVIITTFRKRLYSAIIIVQHQNLKDFRPDWKWKKIELFNEYNKIDFSPKVKE